MVKLLFLYFIAYVLSLLSNSLYKKGLKMQKKNPSCTNNGNTSPERKQIDYLLSITKHIDNAVKEIRGAIIKI